MAQRPLFSTAWAASLRIYDPRDPGARVAQVIGGNVAKNINNPDPDRAWNNTCAVRMSYILNECGVLIPFKSTQTVSGADKRWYFFRVKDVIAFLKKAWGATRFRAEISASRRGPLAGKNGLILFEVSGWSDARGHATLFNGSSCYDHCYFNDPNVTYVTDRANFWSLR